MVSYQQDNVLNMAASYDRDTDPWNALLDNISYAAEKIDLSDSLLLRLLDHRIISLGDYHDLKLSSTRRSQRVDRLLLEILPTRPQRVFDEFCDILREVRQSLLADRLQGRCIQDHSSLQAGKCRPTCCRGVYVVCQTINFGDPVDDV